MFKVKGGVDGRFGEELAFEELNVFERAGDELNVVRCDGGVSEASVSTVKRQGYKIKRKETLSRTIKPSHCSSLKLNDLERERILTSKDKAFDGCCYSGQRRTISLFVREREAYIHKTGAG